jgi:hypothetical protein
MNMVAPQRMGDIIVTIGIPKEIHKEGSIE